MSDEDARAGGSSRFETPLQPLGVSGGTAAFYLVTYRDGEELSDPHPITGEPVGSRGFWIGKDFARARDEHVCSCHLRVSICDRRRQTGGTAAAIWVEFGR